MKMPIGPFGMLDGVGLDTVWDITDYWARQTGDPQTIANAAFVRSYLDHGRLGVKSGRGFYDYPDPSTRRLASWRRTDDRVTGLHPTSITTSRSR